MKILWFLLIGMVSAQAASIHSRKEYWPVTTPTTVCAAFTAANGTALRNTDATDTNGASALVLPWQGAGAAKMGVNLNYCTNQPTVGAELLVNGNMSSGTGWNLASGWAVSGGVMTATSVTQYTITTQNAIFSLGNWYYMSYDRTVGTTGAIGVYDNNTSIFTSGDDNTIRTHIISGRSQTGGTFGFKAMAASQSFTLDNASVKQLTFNECFAVVPYPSSEVNVWATLRVYWATQTGLVVGMDSVNNPKSFMLVYTDGAKVYVDTCSAGTYTMRINPGITYANGAPLKVSKRGATYSVFYNNAEVTGSPLTIVDANLNFNKYHGIFNTYTNQVDNFTITQ